MRFLLDTNTINHLLKGRDAALSRLASAVRAGDEILLCPVVHMEILRYLLLKGATRLSSAYAALARTWTQAELGWSDWEEAARVWSERHRLGRAVEDMDLLIAVIARREGATVVTSNVRHFQDLGVSVVDWAVA